MRSLALFFAIYLSVLGCLPCADELPCAESTHLVVIRMGQPGAGSVPGTMDWCSPLCQCHCCAGFALPTALTMAFRAQPLGINPALCFTARPTRKVPTPALGTLWQPPQARA